jgi:hypothetical protein
MYFDGSDNFYLGGNGSFSLYAGGSSRWQISATGTFISVGDNLYNIGGVGNNRPKDINMAGSLNIGDAGNIVLGTTTGTKIGTATSQKLGFFNATPIIQPAAAAQAAAPAGGTGTAAGGWDTSANRDAAIATINAMRTALVNLGLIKGSA